MLSNTKDLIEKDYQELIKIIQTDRLEIINKKDTAFNDMLEYYTIWAHQIKTPIAAMRLLLQSEQSKACTAATILVFTIFYAVVYVLTARTYYRIVS